MAKPSCETLVSWFLEDPILSPSLNLIFVLSEDTFYLYKDGVYGIMETYDLRKAISNFLIAHKTLSEDDPQYLIRSFSVNVGAIDELIDQMKLMTPRTIRQIESEHIAFKDGKSLNLASFEFEPWNRSKPAFFKVEFESEEVTKGLQLFENSRFYSFLNEIFVFEGTKVPDPDLIHFAQLLCGYLLLESSEAQAAFILNGSGQNGKSVFLEVIRLMLGPNFVSSLSLETLTTRQFAVSNLVGKKVNMVSEDESKHMRSDMLKALVAGDVVTAERKYGASFQFKPRIKFVLASNNLPTFETIDFALRRRLKILPFHRRFTDEEKDTKLIDKLATELPIILAWALEGAKNISKLNFKFPTPTAIKTVMEEFEQEQSSSIEFFSENFTNTSSEDDMVENGFIYSSYVTWCSEMGRKKKSRRTFLRDIESRFNLPKVSAPVWVPQLKKTARVRTYVRLTDDKSAWIHTSNYANSYLPTIQNSSSANPII